MKGKVIGALIGAFLYGAPGFFIGLIGGHFYDVFKRVTGGASLSADQRLALQNSYFETNFKLLGYLAKADGRVSEAEVNHTEQLMNRMGLSTAQRQQAIEYFKQGSAASFSPEQCITEFNGVCGRQPRLKQALLTYLITLALADGHLDPSEKSALEQIAQGLGIPSFLFEQMLGMIQAQASFQQQGGYAGGSPQSSAGDLDKAYQALGVQASATDAEVKKAYRKLISENHPDKLIGQGMPQEMIKLATERSQEISTAYELIQKSRGK